MVETGKMVTDYVWLLSSLQQLYEKSVFRPLELSGAYARWHFTLRQQTFLQVELAFEIAVHSVSDSSI